MKFTEEKLERAFTELLGQEGFSHYSGITITRKPDDVLIENDLRSFLLPGMLMIALYGYRLLIHVC